MKRVLLSVDGPYHLCLVPDIVADNLHKYISDFDDYVWKYKMIKIDENHYRSTVEEITGFIAWLNDKFSEQSKIEKVLQDNEYEEYEQLESWNW